MKTNIETFPELLRRIALEYVDKKFENYIQQLELVASTAKQFVEEKESISELKKALEKLEEVA